MGNKNSTTSNLNDSSETSVIESGVVLSQSLQAEIVQQFENENMQKTWSNIQKGIIDENNTRTLQDKLHSAEVEQALNRWRADNKHVQSQLDDKIDLLRGKFRDLEVSIRYDVEKFESKFDQVPKFGGNDACIDARGGLMACYKNNSDIRKCDVFVQAMENCTKQTIISS
mmetsp:Transcript_17276/g.21111  ORF Transcript_17276/g.21111 Transcript_17276/m.21111 type:complete len:170 (+) Transcript_17276:68-577(+)